MSDQYVKQYVEVGERFIARMPYSEAAMFLLIADKEMEVELLNGGWMAQLYTPDDHKPYSFPVTAGEAGIYRDEQGRRYVVKHSDPGPHPATGWSQLITNVYGEH